MDLYTKIVLFSIFLIIFWAQVDRNIFNDKMEKLMLAHRVLYIPFGLYFLFTLISIPVIVFRLLFL